MIVVTQTNKNSGRIANKLTLVIPRSNPLDLNSVCVSKIIKKINITVVIVSVETSKDCKNTNGFKVAKISAAIEKISEMFLLASR